MICYIQTAAALSLPGRTAWLVRDRSGADLNMIASLDNYWAKITLRRVYTLPHNATDNKRNWGQMQNHHWQDFGDYTDSAGLLGKDKDKLHEGTHLVTLPQVVGAQGMQKPWCPLGGVKKMIFQCCWIGCWHHIPRVLWSDRCSCTPRRGGNDCRSPGPKMFLPSLLLPLFRRGRKRDRALHQITS